MLTILALVFVVIFVGSVAYVIVRFFIEYPELRAVLLGIALFCGFLWALQYLFGWGL